MGDTSTRRRFLAGGGAALAFAASGVVGSATAALAAPAPGLTRSTFLPLVGQQFRVAGSRRTLTLVDVADLRRPAGDAEGCFSLSFDDPSGAVPVQGVFEISHAGAGAHTLLLVPVDRGVNARHIEVIVNTAAGAAQGAAA